jgi:AcrR family transcriptional regulator
VLTQLSSILVSSTVSPSRRASALPPDERRAAIIEAVRPLFVEHGDRLTSRQIAEAAGVAEGTIFRAFTDKEELLSAVLEAVLDPEPLERALAGIDPDLSFERRLVEATELIRRRIVDVWQIVSQLRGPLREQASRPPTDSDELTALFAAERGRLRIEPAAAARMLKALTLSLAHPMLNGEPVTAEEIVGVVLHGIESRDPGANGAPR